MSQKKYISVKGARVNNLKNVDVDLPRKELVLITGVSGSGKSSLAFDTLYAEGQRRYVESLSSYARQFLQRMEKPDVDFIQGLSPAMAIEQKAASKNPRSTVGTTTEIFDFQKLLFARVGKTYSPVSGELVTRDTVTDVVEYILSHGEGARVAILSKVAVRNKGFIKELELALQKGFTRVLEEEEVIDIEDFLEEINASKQKKKIDKRKDFMMLIDRLALSEVGTNETRYRLADSVQTAFQEGQEIAFVQVEKGAPKEFSKKFERDGIQFEVPSVNLFSFNNPYGACKKCEGFGRILGIDEDLVIPDKSKSIFEGAVAWRGESMSEYQRWFMEEALLHDFPIHRPFFELNEQQKEQVHEGIGEAWGIRKFFEYLRSKSHKIQYRVMISRYRGYTVCPDCKGTRVRKDASYVKIDGHSLPSLLLLQVNEILPIFKNLSLDTTEKKIAERLLHEIINRLEYLVRVGLGYLTLNRKIATLSGGEMQRIRLATSLGSGLVGAMYILDEPSIGLHSRDTENLIMIMESLRNKGNTVIVVEHDEAIIRKADYLVDIGPGAGELGGEVVFSGTLEQMIKANTLTAKYLSGEEYIPLPEIRRKPVNYIRLKGARQHNLKGIDVDIPMHALTVVTGVSGSGKTTLIKGILYPAVRRHLEEYGEKPGIYTSLDGDLSEVKYVEMVDQSPLGRSARSNPATYIKAWDGIRDLFCSQPLAKLRNLKPGAFSFNVEGGRCEMCKGDGTVTIEMQFLPDITLTCEACHGKRFKKQMLEVKYKDKNIYDVLNMTIHEAVEFFAEEKKILNKLEILDQVGLGYLRMGQSSTTLSGGEAQRVKLAFFLTHARDRKGTLFIFDEPTTGLHFDDIKKLLYAINELVENGNSVVIIEHNLEVIKCADYLIDLGPEGGDKGGYLVYQGKPEGLLKVESSHTARYLKEKLQGVTS